MMPAVITPFAVRFAANANGDIGFVSNTLMTAPGNGSDALKARNGTGRDVNNNDFSQVYVDIDSDPSTFNSSSADLSMPAGGSVLFAGLYWGGQSTSSSRDKVRFKAPGDASYSTLDGEVIGSISEGDYQGFIDVTDRVRAGGVGTYAVANVQATQGRDREAGWALVVAYADPAAKPRNLTVFDGFAVVDSANSAVTINISGFRAPLTGAVNTSVGFVTYEGDLGYTGDSARFNNITLSDGQNPADNFFNSTISDRGSLATAKSPNYVNQMGIDADIVTKPGLIANGATSASIRLTTGGDAYYPGVVTTAIDLHAPVVNASKSVVDLNGGGVEPGDILEYTDTVSVTGGEAATQFVYLNQLPWSVGYVPGSLTIGGVAMTDAAGDDQAEFQAATGRVTYRLGTGASPSAGGTLGVGQSATVKYRVRVVETTSDGDLIDGQGSASFVGQTTAASLSATSNMVRSIVYRPEDLVLTQAVDDDTPEVGQVIQLSLSVANSRDALVPGVTVKGLLPTGLSFVSAMPAGGTTYDPATGVWDIGMVDGLSPVTMTIFARVVGKTPLTSTATITAASPPDSNTANNTAAVTITPQVADLSLAKSVSAARPNVGDTVTFTTTLTNLGPTAASGVTIRDALPAGFALVSASGAPYEGGAWSMETVPVGASTLTLTAVVTDPAPSTMTASILTAATSDPRSSNNTASVSVSPQRVDVSITKVVDVARPNVGAPVVLTTRVKNAGADGATGVVVLSPVGAGLTITSVTAPAGTSYDQETGTWTVGTLAASGELVLKVTATVDDPDAIVSTATLADVDQADRTRADDSASASISPQSADLAPTIAISDASPVAGQAVTLTIKVKNTGPDAATNVRIAEALPDGFQFVSSSADAGTYDPTTGLWSIASVGSGQTRTLTITARALVAGTATHTASVSAVDQHDPNTGNDSASVSSSVVALDLALASAFSNKKPKVGEEVDYVITLSSPGTADAAEARVSAPLPAGLSFISAQAEAGEYSSETGTWDVGAVPAGTTVVLTIRAAVRPEATAKVTAKASLVPNPADVTASNDMATATLTARSSDLALTATVDKAVPRPMDTMTFTLTVTNRGPDDATDIAVEHEPIASGLEFLGFEGDGTYDPASSRWELGGLVLRSGESASLKIRARPTDADPHAIAARIVQSDQHDGDGANDAASVSFDAQQANLSVSVDVSDTSPKPGQEVTLTIFVNNLGPDPATNVRLQTALPAGLSFVEASGPGTYRPADGVWLLGGLSSEPLGSAMLTIKAIAVGPTAGDVSAAILAPEQFDSSDWDDSATIRVAPRETSLSISAVVDDARPNVGDVVTVSVSVSNASASTTENVVVRAPIPAGASYDPATDLPEGTTYDPDTGLWTIPAFLGESSRTLMLRLRIDEPLVKPLIAEVRAADAYNTNAAYRPATVAIDPLRADLALEATVDVARPNANQVVTFTITLSNLGSDPATGVAVSVPIPAGYAFDSASSPGSYDESTGLWAVGAVDPGTPAVLTLRAAVTSATAPPMVATIIQADQHDGSPANDEASAFVKPRKVDLVVGKAVSEPAPNVGDTITYTLVVKNGGEDDATGVIVSDVLPAGMSFVGAVGDGSYDDEEGVWAIGSLAKGAEATLIITVTVASAAPTVNTASVAGVHQFDVHIPNDGATTVVDPQQADLLLTAIVDDPSPLVGQVVTFTIDVKNLGKDGTNGVTVRVTLPDGLEFVDATPPVGMSYDAQAGIWTIGDVGSLGTASMALRARVLSADAATLAVSVGNADQFDPNAANDVASSTVQAQTSDLGLKFTIDEPRPSRGQVVKVDLDLTNAGPDDATGLIATVPIPDGFELVSFETETGAYDPDTGSWAIGGQAAGSTRRLTLTLRTIAGDPITLSASAVADQFDPVPDDANIAAFVAPMRSDLSISTAVDDDRPDAGQVVAFSITIDNSGPDPAANVAARAALPDGLEYVGSTAGLGTYDATTGAWTIAEVPGGWSGILTIYARVVSPSARTLTATIDGSDSFELTDDDLTSSATETPKASDVRVRATIDNPTPNVGDLVTVRVVVSNLGPDEATGVAILSLLPPGLDALGLSVEQGAFNPADGRWLVGEVPAGGERTLVYQFRVTGPAPVPVTTSVESLDQFNSTAEGPRVAELTPRVADVGLAITPGDARPNVGDTVAFTIVASNAGPDAARGLRVATTLGGGLTFEGAGLPDGSTYDPITGDWIIAELPAGASLTLTLRATVAEPGGQSASARVSGVDEFDPTEGDRSATATVTSREIRLALAQEVSDAAPVAGEVVELTVTLTNSGPDAATATLLRQFLPPGMELVEARSDAASYDEQSGTWSIPALPSGQAVVLRLRARVVAPGALTPGVAFVSADQHVAEPVAPASTTITPQSAGVGIAAAVDASRPDANQPVEITITATNSGPDAATGVRISAILPAGLAFDSADAGGGAYDPTTGIWSPGAIAAGSTAVLRLRARATAMGPVVATARLESVDQFDATTTDDLTAVSLSARRADLSVRIEGLPGKVTVGGRHEIRVIVSNAGPDGASGVALPISIPAGFRLVSHAQGAGTFDPATGRWVIGALPAGGSTVLALTLEAITPGALTITAGPATSGQFGEPLPATVTSTLSEELAPPPTAGPEVPTPSQPSPAEPTAPPPVVPPPAVPTPDVPVAPTPAQPTPAVPTPAVPTAPTPAEANPTVPAPPAATTADLSGAVYLDRNRNGVYDAGFDLGVATVRVILVGTDTRGNAVRVETTTAADGTFSFQGLQPGTYSIIKRAPGRFFRPTRASVGPLGGRVVDRVQVDGIGLAAGDNATGYAFGNLPAAGCRMNLLMRRGGPESVRGGPLLSRFFPILRAHRATSIRLPWRR